MMKLETLYDHCGTCGGQVDVSVPREFCPFCNTPAAKKFTGLLPFAVGVGYFVVSVGGPAFAHDKGKLVPKDLPHEQIDLPHSGGNSTALPQTGWGQLATIANVTTSPGSIGIQGDGVHPLVLQWPSRRF